MGRPKTGKAAELYAKLAEVKGIYDKITEDGVADEDVPQETKSQIINLNKEIEDLNAAVMEGNEFKGLRDGHLSLLADLDKPNHKAGHPGGGGGSAAAVKTVGEQFVENNAFKSWIDSIMPNGTLPNGFRIGESPALPAEGLMRQAMKTLITGASSTSGGAMVNVDVKPLVELPFRPLTIRDIITNGRTGSDTVEYPRVTGYTNNAAATAEATTTSNGTKPESAMALERVAEAVKTIAHWIPVTKRALADAPQLETYINAFLLQGLAEVLETEIISGDGTGEHFLGVSNQPGIGSQAYDTSIVVTARKALTKVRTSGRKPATAYVMHPNDWEAYDLSVDNEQRYYFGGPQVLGTPRLWGRPVVECEGCTEGTGYVGYWPGAVVWDREQANIRMSDSHASFFIQNLVAILAELRAAFGLLFPAAIIEMDLTA